jgi:uncharacterized protein (DUF58 family)
MRLTRRGWATLAVAVGALVLGTTYGARSLDALLIPAAVAIGAGLVQLARTREPTVSRTRPAPGYPGETRRVELTVETALACDVREGSSGGVRPVQADLALEARGEHEVGPTEVTVHDALGLLARTTQTARSTPVLVYPSVRPIANRRAFVGLVERTGTRDRQAFDRLREYVPGDALRDVNWKASSKRAIDDLVVTEFATDDEGGITIVCESDAGHADAMAEATASIATYLLDADLAVGISAPGGDLDQHRGDEQLVRALELLARTPAGRVSGDRRDRADVRVFAGDDGVRIDVRDQHFSFEDLVSPDAPAPMEVAV